MTKAKLQRTKDGYAYQGCIIEKREWILPFASTTWRVLRDGKKLDEYDSLNQLRSDIDDLLAAQ